jgi:hypothetical protein
VRRALAAVGLLALAEVDPQGQDAVLDAGIGITEHGEVHVVGPGLLLEALTIGSLDRREAPGANGIGPGPEALHHGLGVELIGHGPMVPGPSSRDE